MEIGTNAAESTVLPRSVVKPAYKLRYAEREAAMQRRPKGIPRKALARCNGDWLALELARYTLDEKGSLVVALFEQVLTDNGVAHEKWNRTTKGWQGRLRMTGRLALERVVAQSGKLIVDGDEHAAPKAWIAAHKR